MIFNILHKYLCVVYFKFSQHFSFQVGKVSPRVQPQQNWADHRSQSSEDVFQEEISGVDPPKTTVFHSRGSSPISAKKFTVENGFRRNDPKRHSSPRINMRSDNRMRLSPPKPPIKRNTQTPNSQAIQNGTPTRRMFWSPERQQNSKMLVTRKNSAPASDENSQLPVIEKLKQHSDLCTDKDFLMKIEQLIEEFQAKTKMDDFDDFGRTNYSSLPSTLKEELDSKSGHLHMRKSPAENNIGKSPSKIPLPVWYPKCQS